VIPYGIIASTPVEIELLLRAMVVKQVSFVQGKPFHIGRLNGKEAILCICGVGKTNAAHGASLLLDRFQPSVVYVVGVAGAYPSSKLRIGDIAVAEKEIYGDEGLRLNSGLKTMDALGLPLAIADGTDYYNEFPLYVPDKLLKHQHKGTFVTVSSCTGTFKAGLEIEKTFNAICENMEGAAVVHISLLNRVRAVEMRGISNIIEDREGRPLDKAAIRIAADNVQQFFLDTLANCSP